MGDWGAGAKGAAGGALAGGSIGGPIGAGIGGIIGGVSGFLGGGESDADKQNRDRLNQYYQEMQNRQFQGTGPASQSGYSSFRQNQSDYINRLDAMSRGQGPSLAMQTFQQTTDRNNAGQQAMAASGRGGPLAAFNAASNMGTMGAQAAQGAAAARTNEQMLALGQEGGAINQARGSDESTNQFNAGQNNQVAIANMDARLRAMGMNDQTRLQILGQLGGQNQAAKAPGLGDQILAGGASMYAQGAMNQARSPMQGPAQGLGWSGAGGPFSGAPNSVPGSIPGGWS